MNINLFYYYMKNIKTILFLLAVFSILLYVYYINKNNQKIDTDHMYEYIVIGSGPAGLQAGHFLNKFNKDYIILEKADNSGDFFKKYPIHRKLISVNKVNTGSEDKEFNLRHDWNSLLSDNDKLLFKNYTKDFFPHADYMVKYLNDYQKINNIKVAFNQNVITINKENDIFKVQTTDDTLKCKKLIMAAGLMKNNISFTPPVNSPGCLNYRDLSRDKSMFLNKNVCIIGKGNSAFETANYLTDTAAVIQVFTKGGINHAWDTHYPGHLRAINNEFLDVYNLKTQHAVNSVDDTDKIVVFKENNKYFVVTDSDLDNNGNLDMDDHKPGENIDQHPEGGFDYVIDCTGFKIDTSIFGNIIPDHNGKVPYVKGDFESKNIDNLYFAGVLSQEISYKYGSAAFIHGFRYLISSMIKIDTGNLEITTINSMTDLNKKIIHRMNTTSALYQMFNCLCDVVIFDNDQIIYIEEVTIRYAKKHYVEKYKKVLLFSLKYCEIYKDNKEYIKKNHGFGTLNKRNEKDYIAGLKETAHLSHFIHPVFDLYYKRKHKEEFHLAEHLVAEFKLPGVHIEPLKDLLEKVKQYNKHEKKEKKNKKQCLTDNEKQIEDILSNYIFGGKINSLNDDEIDKLSNKIDMLEKQFMCEM
jgi:thioredoxin reductase